MRIPYMKFNVVFQSKYNLEINSPIWKVCLASHTILHLNLIMVRLIQVYGIFETTRNYIIIGLF